MFVPTIATNRNGVDQREDILSAMLSSNRTIYITGEITDEMAMSVRAQVQWLSQQNQDDIIVVIDSPGGSVYAGLAIYDVLRLSGCEVQTYAWGLAASMGAFFLAAAGSPGKRLVSPETQVMIHQPIGGITGQATDIGIVADHIGNMKARLTAVLARRTGQSCERVMQDCERNMWMDAAQAVEYGLADTVAKHLPGMCM